MDEPCTTKKCRHDGLDFDAPLLSTRRLGSLEKTCELDVQITWSDTPRRVPFLWERVPGEPKITENGLDSEEQMPPPKLPPGRLQSSNKDCNRNCFNENDSNGDDDDDDLFSDAMDMISLSESLDMHCGTSHVSGLGGLDLKAVESCGDQSPNFIMSRFLPAATALASSSTLIASKNSNGRPSPHRHGMKNEIAKPASSYQLSTSKIIGECGGPHGAVRTCSPSKSCGLMFFFPWNLKHALCRLKCQIPRCSPRLKLKGDVGRADVVKRGNGSSGAGV
ncbi:uncharacterized protein LOC131254045 [Magnolia sinica]|uniref:uncharacterized protein LOC131254045 n=1 Tax=Magnolia sinica TaxID=86752 RepID=UPI002658C29D|nr:uncharacterized protein LOC131254045 [Magnolia sinica]